jgi:hypothetical protein
MLKLFVGKEYKFKNQPQVIVYLDYVGGWHRFTKPDSSRIWAELLGHELDLIEAVEAHKDLNVSRLLQWISLKGKSVPVRYGKHGALTDVVVSDVSWSEDEQLMAEISYPLSQEVVVIPMSIINHVNGVDYECK